MTTPRLLVLLLSTIWLLAAHDLWRDVRRKKRRVIRFALTRISINSKPIKEHMNIRLSVAQFAALAFSPVDAEGKPSTLDGKPVITVLDGDVTVRTVNDEFLLVPGDQPGKARVKVSGDGEQGDGETIIEEIIELEITPANAVSLGLGYRLGSKSELPPVTTSPQ